MITGRAFAQRNTAGTPAPAPARAGPNDPTGMDAGRRRPRSRTRAHARPATTGRNEERTNGTLRDTTGAGAHQKRPEHQAGIAPDRPHEKDARQSAVLRDLDPDPIAFEIPLPTQGARAKIHSGLVVTAPRAVECQRLVNELVAAAPRIARLLVMGEPEGLRLEGRPWSALDLPDESTADPTVLVAAAGRSRPIPPAS